MEPVILPTGIEPVQVDCTLFYARSNELTPLEGLENLSIPDLVWDIESVHWTQACSALLSVRRLVRFHPLFLESHIADILQACLKQTKNLRSVVSKTALLCVSDLLQICQSQLLFTSEETMRSCLRTLLEISTSGKKFLALESDSALQGFIMNSSPCCIARIGLHEVQHHSPAYRSALVRIVLSLLEKHSKEGEIKVCRNESLIFSPKVIDVQETIASLWSEKLNELV